MTKQIVALTPSAIERVRELIEAGGGKVLRLGTKTAGCSGVKYDFNFVDEPNPMDLEVDAGGAKIYVDAMSLIFIAGTEIDWTESGLSRSFEFRNPNETARCGCGESFTTTRCN